MKKNKETIKQIIKEKAFSTIREQIKNEFSLVK